MPVSGYIGSKSGGHKVPIYGWFEMPNLVIRSDQLNLIAEAVHTAVSWALLCLVTIHASAALWHHFYLKDTVLKRMLPVPVTTDTLALCPDKKY